MLDGYLCLKQRLFSYASVKLNTVDLQDHCTRLSGRQNIMRTPFLYIDEFPDLRDWKSLVDELATLQPKKLTTKFSSVLN